MPTKDHRLGAPAEIEITEKMIAAGAKTLDGFLIEDANEGNSSFSDRCDVAEMVLRAALREIDPVKLRELLHRLNE